MSFQIAPQIQLHFKIDTIILWAHRMKTVEAQADRHVVSSPVAPTTVMPQAISEWNAWMLSTGRSERHAMNAVRTLERFVADARLAARTPSDVTASHIGGWINNPANEVKLSSRRCMLSYFSSFFDFCAARGLLKRSPSAQVQVDTRILSDEQKSKGSHEPFTQREVEKLVSNTEGFWRCAVLLASEAGLRLGQICELEWTALATPGAVLVAGHLIPISERLHAWIFDTPVTSDRYVWSEEQETHLSAGRRAYLSLKFRRLCERQDIHGKSFEDLRRAFLARNKANGHTWEAIMSKLARPVE